MSFWDFMLEWGWPAVIILAALTLMAVAMLRDRALQKELDRLYAHEDRVDRAEVFIEIADGDIVWVKADKSSDVVNALADALGTQIGRHLGKGYTLRDCMALVVPLIRSCAAEELRRQGKPEAIPPQTRREALLELLEDKRNMAKLLQTGTETMNQCAWCDPDKRRCGMESCEPGRERQCVLQWLEETGEV